HHRHRPGGRRRRGRGRAVALPGTGHPRAYQQPRRVPRPRCAVQRRHLVQPGLRAPVRGYPRADARIAGPAGHPAPGDPGVLRTRVHAQQRRLCPGGGAREPGPARTQRGSRTHAREGTTDIAVDAGQRAVLQPVPAHRCARRARSAGRPGWPRPGRRPDGAVRGPARLEGRFRGMSSARAVVSGLAAALLSAACALPALAGARAAATGAQLPAVAAAVGETVRELQPVSRNGREIYEQFRAGLADPHCTADASERWRRHFSHVPGELAERPERLLPLFGYVVDALREYHLPTEYALIPFVESGYRPGARSPSGPAGLWQFITI